MGAGPEALSGDVGVVAYVDSSALVRAYLSDEDGHVAMRKRLETGAESFVSSALTNVELTAAVNAASRHGRVADPHATIEKLLAYQRGFVLLIGLDGDRVLPIAQALCARHKLRALDAVHLAVALTDGSDLAEGRPLVFITRDADQAAAARAEGLVVE